MDILSQLLRCMACHSTGHRSRQPRVPSSDRRVQSAAIFPVDKRLADAPTPCCWICLEPGQLTVPCQCSTRPVHPQCLARWQLQAAGKLEETHCRFCHDRLPDWRSTLVPSSAAGATRPPHKLQPVAMTILHGSETYQLLVQPGPEGQAQFKQQVRQLLGLKGQEDFDCCFGCQDPMTGADYNMTGLRSYAAATSLAATIEANHLQPGM